MPDVQAWLGIAGLVSGIGVGVGGAYTTWRKDQREQHLEPITKRDAILAQSGAAMERMVNRMERSDSRSDRYDDRMERYDERLDKFDVENQKLREDLDLEREARQHLGYTVDHLKETIARWVRWGHWVQDNWSTVRLLAAPPALPDDIETGAGWYPQPERND